MLANYHMHTNYSDDSSFELEELIKTAISYNLDEICITDHLDCMTYYPNCFPLTQYSNEIKYFQKKYNNQIKIKMGMEFGMQRGTIDTFNKIFSQLDFDFILMSCHLIDDKWLFNQSFQNNKTQDEYNKQYYEEILYLTNNFDHYSVLGHLDVIRRYDPKGDYPFEKVADIIEKILKRVISQNKGIELNTSSYRYRLEDTMPSSHILQMYKDLGGEIITVGTDSHCPSHVNCGLEEAYQTLKKFGYKKYCTFDKMGPIFHKL